MKSVGELLSEEKKLAPNWLFFGEEVYHKYNLKMQLKKKETMPNFTCCKGQIVWITLNNYFSHFT